MERTNKFWIYSFTRAANTSWMGGLLASPFFFEQLPSDAYNDIKCRSGRIQKKPVDRVHIANRHVGNSEKEVGQVHNIGSPLVSVSTKSFFVQTVFGKQKCAVLIVEDIEQCQREIIDIEVVLSTKLLPTPSKGSLLDGSDQAGQAAVPTSA